MEAKQYLVVHSVLIHQRPLSEMMGRTCTVSFSIMGPGTAAGNVYFFYQMPMGPVTDHPQFVYAI